MFCQLLSVLFSDALIRADKWFILINVSLLLCQGVLYGLYVVVQQEDHFYFIIGSTPYTRNLTKRFFIVQWFVGLVPVFIETVQDPKRFRIRLLSSPLHRFQVASWHSFDRASKKEKHEILKTLAATEMRLLAARRKILNNYGGVEEQTMRHTMNLRYAKRDSFEMFEHVEENTTTTTVKRTPETDKTMDNKTFKQTVLCYEVAYSILLLSGTISYLLLAGNQHTKTSPTIETSQSDIHLEPEPPPASSLSNATLSSTPSSVDQLYVYPTYLVSYFWVLCLLVVAVVVRRFLCCGRTTHVDLEIMKQLVQDPTVILLSVCGILLILVDITWPTEYTEVNVTLKIGFIAQAVTLFLGDATIRMSRRFEIFNTSLFFLCSLYNQYNVWASNFKGENPVIWLAPSTTCQSPQGPIPTFTKGSILRVLYSQFFVNLLLVMYRVWWV